MKYVVALLIALLASPASAAQWVVYGQTSVTNGASVSNPTPNTNGLNGEVASLPYTVPGGKTLTVTVYGIESYNSAGDCSIIPWIGGGAFANATALPPASATHGTRQTITRLVIPAGGVFNILLTNGESSTQVFGWFASGTLD